ncbi:MAG: hypothetical protein E7201_01945 [Selenomonas ruminantium]|uniref:Uncharacterized protein n=1 Tax=Selenomonas ruminantium TaxID=971 RepID=A0A927WLM3_SELRU|nr:hypothetical protein [Selenomonas ruminantium]
MIVWTKKAQNDWRARYPHRKNDRIAGAVAMYDGRVIPPIKTESSIFSAFLARGWLEVIKTPEQKQAPAEPEEWMTEKERRRIWYKLYFLIEEQEKTRDLPERLGLTKTEFNKYISRYGRDMAAKYGKLPYRPDMYRFQCWRRIMAGMGRK